MLSRCANSQWGTRRVLSCTAFMLLVLSLAMGLGTGCGLVPDPAPDTARIVVDGVSDTEVELITSTVFLARNRADGLGRQVLKAEIVDADTFAIDLPFEQTYDIQREQRFLARVRPRVDTTSLESVRLRGFVDGDRRFVHDATETDSLMQFVYVYQGSAPPDEGRL